MAPRRRGRSWSVRGKTSATEFFVLVHGLAHSLPHQGATCLLVDTSKPATDRHCKTGHHGRGTRDQSSSTSSLVRAQGGEYLSPPAAWSALEHMSVMQRAIKQRGDGRGIAEQLAPAGRPKRQGPPRRAKVSSRRQNALDCTNSPTAVAIAELMIVGRKSFRLRSWR
jgi:hypothetical protein